MRPPLASRGARLVGVVVLALVAIGLLWGIPRWRAARESARAGTTPIVQGTTVAGAPTATLIPQAMGSSAPASAAASARPSAAASAAAASMAPRPTAAASGASGAAASVAPATGAQPASLVVPEVPRKIIKNGTLTMIVGDVESAVVQASGIAVLNGGDVAQATNNKSGESHTADMVLAVPSETFEKVMKELREISGVRERRIDKIESQDATEEYVDIQAQILNLEATERRVRALMEQATKMDDILLLQREATNLRGQIERLQGRANLIDRRAATSKITLHFELPPPPPSPSPTPSPTPSPSPEPVVEAAPPPPSWSFGAVVGSAWERSLNGLQRVITVVATGLILAWWIILPVMVALIVWWARRRRSRRIVGAEGGAVPVTGD